MTMPINTYLQVFSGQKTRLFCYLAFLHEFHCKKYFVLVISLLKYKVVDKRSFGFSLLLLLQPWFNVLLAVTLFELGYILRLPKSIKLARHGRHWTLFQILKWLIKLASQRYYLKKVFIKPTDKVSQLDDQIFNIFSQCK